MNLNLFNFYLAAICICLCRSNCNCNAIKQLEKCNHDTDCEHKHNLRNHFCTKKFVYISKRGFKYCLPKKGFIFIFSF